MICYNYKSEKFNFWATIRLIGKYKMFGYKPKYYKECITKMDFKERHLYNDSMRFELIPLFEIGDGRSVKNYYFAFTWLIFDFGFGF